MVFYRLASGRDLFIVVKVNVFYIPRTCTVVLENMGADLFLSLKKTIRFIPFCLRPVLSIFS